MKVAVVAHTGKTLGAACSSFVASSGPVESKTRSGSRCRKSRKAPAQVRRALDEGAERLFAWGGDGMVQQCVDVLAGSAMSLAIIPAGPDVSGRASSETTS